MEKNTVQDPESKPGFFCKTNPKTGFFMGLMVGITVVSLVGFLSLLTIVIGENKEDGTVAGKTKTVQPTANTNGNINTAPTAAPSGTKPAAGIVLSEDDHSKGPENAAVTVVEYSDFECPYCARHFETMKNIQEKYKDQVRFIYRHFPLSFHTNARPAANAAECASEQGKFWEMHDKIFENKTLSDEGYAGFAQEIGLDSGKFKECYESKKYDQAVSDDMASGIESGVEGTPATFVITDKDQVMISGAVPQSQAEASIDKALK